MHKEDGKIFRIGKMGRYFAYEEWQNGKKRESRKTSVWTGRKLL